MLRVTTSRVSVGIGKTEAELKIIWLHLQRGFADAKRGDGVFLILVHPKHLSEALCP